jgi:hypothetical protein
MASGVAMAYILVFVRFPELSGLHEFPDMLCYVLSTIMLSANRWTDFVIIFLTAGHKYSGIVLILLGAYMWFRTRKALKQTQPQNSVS